MSLPNDVDKVRAYLSGLAISRKYERTCKNVDSDAPFNEIQFGKELKKIPAKFRTDVLNFISYLKETADKSFLVTHRNKSTGDESERELPYIHRWTEIYRRGFLAKMYQLEAYLGVDVTDATMITLTTSQRGLDPEQCLFKLLEYYNKLFKILRKRFGTLDYFYILEPHKTGYPHMHIMYMKKLTELEQNEIKTIWSKKYEAGSFENGVNFSEPRASETGEFASGSISRVRGYLMKYISKGLHAETMQPYELLFNALLKKNKIRLYNCSRNFSKIMRQAEKPEDADYECVKVELLQSGYKEALPEDKPKFSCALFIKGRKMAVPMIKTFKYVSSLPFLFKSDIKKRDSLGWKIEYDPKIDRYNLFEPVYIPVDSR